jgi:hypothetical protein
LFGANSSNTDSGNIELGFLNTNAIGVVAWNIFYLISTPVYRDPSGWYHIVFAVDTTNATANNRMRLYVNGVEVTAFGTRNNPTQNSDLPINSTTGHQIGAIFYSSPSGLDRVFDGYLDEINFIDGQQLTPSSFGATNPSTGAWQPRKYTGTYGTNGFYLPFTDNSALTTSSNVGLGRDFSGNGNYWTTNNISITAGVTYDSMTDVPTLTDITTANYPVLNPLLSAGGTTANGNLQVTTTAGVGHSRATMAIPASGKWYCEYTAVSAATSTDYIFGIVGIDTPEASYGYNQTPSYSYTAFGERIVNGSFTGSFYASFTTGDIIGCAVNLDTNEINWYKNGTLTGSATSITNGSYFWMVSDASGSRQITAALNFGQRPFAYTPPTGFVRLNTFNLPTPTIGASAATLANKYFDATVYAGNGAANSSTVQTISTQFAPDLLWIKNRTTGSTPHILVDVLRGNNSLSTNNTNADESNGNQALISNGYTVTEAFGSGNPFNPNLTGNNYVGWVWDAGSSTVTNTAGTISAQVSANTSAGFSVVTFTVPTSGTATIGHGLGVAPAMIITKNRNGTIAWNTYHQSLGNTQYVLLNSTAASATLSTLWNSTSPTSSVFSMGSAFANTGTYVAYCFAQVAGYSAFGSYTGNGSADGPFVFTGFRPRYVMIKQTSGLSDWWVWDTARQTFNQMDAPLYPNTSAAETSNAVFNFDILSNGFKMRSTNATVNGSGLNYIYAAFAESPFKYANAR